MLTGPKEIFVFPSFEVGAYDIRFSDPREQRINQEFLNSGGVLVGVQVYRSESEFGHYEKITETPVGSFVFRDRTQQTQIVEEDVTDRFVSKFDNERRELTFRVKNVPMVKNGTQGIVANGNSDIQVLVFNPSTGLFERVQVATVRGDLGLVTMISAPIFDTILKRTVDPLVPNFDLTQRPLVKCTYFHGSRIVTNQLYQRLFYKVAVVGEKDGNPVESSLDGAVIGTWLRQEPIDFVWTRAIEMNQWILEQGGERAKLFTRKWLGKKCTESDTFRKQAHNDCQICYGTQTLGGYDGPFEILIAPPDAQKTMEWSELGLRTNFSYESWTSHSPLLHHWDMVIRPDGTRYVLNNVNHIGSRGAIYQQHFTMSLVDEKDIMYRVPVYGVSIREGPVPGTVSFGSASGATADSPFITDKPGIEKDKVQRGNTITWENITYGGG